jgi:thiamine biosynthesis lipoprotein
VIRALLGSLLAGVLGLQTPAVPVTAVDNAAPPLRLSAAAFGGRAMVEVRDLEPAAAQAAARAALDTIRELDALSDPQGTTPGGLGALNRAAGAGPQSLQPRLMQLLSRAKTFCDWSEGAHGPLGGKLYALWGLRGDAPGLPNPERLETARAAAACDRLRLEPSSGRVNLAEGSEIDPWGFAAGFAVDEAVAALRASGVKNGWASAGGAQRGFGGGPAGKGWPATLPKVSGSTQPADSVLLVDQALAFADRDSHRMRAGGEEFAPYLDQRRGRPTEGMLLVAASSELAIDAQALAVAAFVMGNREAQFRMGNLRPKPALFWAAGSGEGEPMILSSGWSALRRNG